MNLIMIVTKTVSMKIENQEFFALQFKVTGQINFYNL